MSKMRASRFNLLVSAAVAAALAPQLSRAGEAATPVSTLDEVQVVGQIVYRDRVDAAPPVLEYGLDYFQRFEPPTVGDMLKRVPGVGFLSDTNEFDGVRMRGLDASYTKILINGKKVPGAESDRSFWVDRIPAELIDHIEIVRSSSSDVSADGVGGTLNIVLKESSELEGGYGRAGALFYDGDDKLKPSVGGVFGGGRGDWRYTLGANAQGRHNAKDKVTRFTDDAGVLTGVENEDDVRDGMDYTGHFSLQGPMGPLEFGLKGFYVHTDRDEHQIVEALEDNGGVLEPDGFEDEQEDIKQDNYSLDASFALPIGMGKTSLDLGFARFSNDIETVVTAGDTLDELEPDTLEFDKTRDREFSATLAHVMDMASGKWKLGVDWQDKKRDGDVTVLEWDGVAYQDESDIDGVYQIKERRIDPFVKYSGEYGALLIEGGVRFEMTDLDVVGDGGSASNDYSLLAPSLHARYSLSGSTRIYGSVSRTARRADFNWLAPYEDDFEDEDRRAGNPDLKPERAWGTDLGIEHRIGRQGIVGLNFLYRSLDDVIEQVSTGQSVPEGGFLYTFQNVGSAKVWGAELDLSAPLAFSPNTGVFFNAALLDSEFRDPLLDEKRRLQNQPKYIFNGGFIQNLPLVEMAFGATYRKQGAAFQVELDERRRTTYEGDLEVFVEKRFGEVWTARLTATNLLDSHKVESIRNYDGDTVTELMDNLRADNVDEFELEDEHAGAIIQLVFRATF